MTGIRILWIAVIVLLLIILTPIRVYSYTNNVARTTDQINSDDYSMINIGLTPTEDATVTGGVLLGSGIMADIGAYYIVIVPKYTCKIRVFAPVKETIKVTSYMRLQMAQNEYYERNAAAIASGEIDDSEIASDLNALEDLISPNKYPDTIIKETNRGVIKTENIYRCPQIYNGETSSLKIYGTTAVIALVIVGSCLYIWWSST